MEINPSPDRKPDKLVRLTIHFVELSKDYNKLFGFKWQPGFTADDPKITFGAGQTGAPSAAGTSFTATLSSLFPRLESAQNAGFARILKTGTLIVRNGQPATLVDETEIPFAVAAGNGQVASQTARVGTRVSATPAILGKSDDLQLDLIVTQNNLTGRSGNVPIVTAHQVDTKIYVRSSESAAVAGLVSADVSTNFNKDDPREGSFEGSTSPLFTLLRSKNYTKRKGQFVIFVTPQIIENASEGTEDLRRNFRIKVK
jgi:pilus assembly protein CpaC